MVEGRRGQFDVLVNGRMVATRKGGLIAKFTKRPWPDPDDVVAAVREATQPYQLWREPLRRLMLAMPPDDLTAGILLAILPDLPDLLKRSISNVPELRG